MRIYQAGKTGAQSALVLSFCLFLLVACGTNQASGSTPSTASTTATACTQTTRPATAFRTTIGTLKSISGQTLVVTTVQGSSSTVTYSSSTAFTQEVKLASSDLKEGESVRVAVTSTGSTYTAVSVQVSTGAGATKGAGFPGFSGTPGSRRGTGTNPCFAGRRTGTGTGTNNFRGLIGTVSQVNGDILTITDSAGSSYTVTMDAKTQIIETKSTTAAALKVGEPLTILGKPGAQNTIAATTIAILLNLPARGTPVATPTA
jgi:hypothetical protein